MDCLSPENLSKVLKAAFPTSATCWSQATDELRDMCREARILAGVSEEGAVNFLLINTPAQWNQRGIEGTIRFYEMLDELKRQQFCSRFEFWLTSWLHSQPSPITGQPTESAS